jgi:hypothetical protein
LEPNHKDKVANEENPPDVAGDDSDAKDESLMWDVTKAQACVERLLQLFPKMTLDKARSLLEVVCGDYIDDSEVLQTTAANAARAKVFGDPKYTEAKNAGGDSLDNFLPLLTDLRAEAKAWKKEQRDARRGKAAKKASATSDLIIDLKARYAGEKKKQKQAEEARQDTLLQLQTLEASRDKLSGQVSEAYKNAKKSEEKVEKLKTQVKVYKESKVVGVDGSEGQKNGNASRP